MSEFSHIVLILLFLVSSNVSDENDQHQRVCLHAEVLVPFLGQVYILS